MIDFACATGKLASLIVDAVILGSAALALIAGLIVAIVFSAKASR